MLSPSTVQSKKMVDYVESESFKRLQKPLKVKAKLLMGPGPSNPHPRVILAMSIPLLGHFHQRTFEIMDEVKAGIQYIFRTQNPVTMALSTSGHGGMEAAMCNLVEQEDSVLILVNGIWGQRAADMARRYGGNVVTIEVAPGRNFCLSDVEEAVLRYRPVLLFVTQGESSTGVYQPILGLGDICHRHKCLLVVDTVASLGGVPFYADAWGVDCVYTGSQKTLGAPPGLTPISFSENAMQKIRNRRRPPSVFYWDVQPLGQYWNCYPGLPRIYHHTICTPLLYALREALTLIIEEGLEETVTRHEKAAAELHAGLKRLGLQLFVEDVSARLPTVTTVSIPLASDWTKIVSIMLNEYDVEIAGGLGPTAGKVLRIGVMGFNAESGKVSQCISALGRALHKASL